MDNRIRVDEEDGFERGRMESELRHLYLSNLGFGRIGKGADAFDKVGVYSILDSLIRLGGRFPGTHSLKYIRDLQSKLESRTSSDEVVALVVENRNLICEAFGVKDNCIDDCIRDIQSLDSPVGSAGEGRALMRLNESLLLIDENGSRNE